MINRTWKGLEKYTWSQLSSYKWGDFRTAYMESETTQSTNGVSLETAKVVSEISTSQKVQGVVIEHSKIISNTETEMITSVIASTRNHEAMLLKYLPIYERTSITFVEIMKAYAREFRPMSQDMEIVTRNMLLDTRIESLYIDERDLGIVYDDSLTYNQRREQIVARYRAIVDQTTEETISEVASAYGNGEVDINKTSEVGVYEIRFTGVGIPRDIEEFKEVIEGIIPAHLGLKFVYTFATWGDISHMTWADASKYTWDEIREVI